MQWRWRFWTNDKPKEDEIIVYSPKSYESEVDEYFVVVLFRMEDGRDWWLCQFKDPQDPARDVEYLRVENYGSRLREAMTTCYAMNKIIGAV